MATDTARSAAELDAENDVAALMEGYGPGSVVPLTPVDWVYGPGRVASAEVPGGETSFDALAAYALLGVYALVLGDMQHWQRGNRRTYVVMGRIGPRRGADGRPRTLVVLRTTVRSAGAA